MQCDDLKKHWTAASDQCNIPWPRLTSLELSEDYQDHFSHSRDPEKNKGKRGFKVFDNQWLTVILQYVTEWHAHNLCFKWRDYNLLNAECKHCELTAHFQIGEYFRSLLKLSLHFDQWNVQKLIKQPKHSCCKCVMHGIHICSQTECVRWETHFHKL